MMETFAAIVVAAVVVSLVLAGIVVAVLIGVCPGFPVNAGGHGHGR
jgi:hypothetical protein